MHLDAVKVAASKPELSKWLGSAVAAASAEAIAATGQFHVALSGGSLPKLLAAGLVGDAAPEAAKQIDYTKWQVWFADERVGSLDHDDSNFKACKEVP